MNATKPCRRFWSRCDTFCVLVKLRLKFPIHFISKANPSVDDPARTIDGTTDLVLLLELQGRPERHMVLRTTTYNILAVQELIEHDKELRRGERRLGVKAMLRSKGFESDRLAEAMTMGAVVTGFQRSLDDIRQEGREAGQVTVLRQLAARKFGRRTAEKMARLLAQIHDGEQISRVAAAVVDCDVPDDFLARVG